jgi:nucleotide-binding universal stress UspA family protein
MGMATVMVHYAGGETSNRRALIARDVASWFGARLIGIAAYPAPQPVSGDLVGGEQDHLPGGDFVEDERVATPDPAPIASWLAEVAAEFRSIMGETTPAQWRSATQDPGHYLIREARAADLVVLGPMDSAAQVELIVDPASVLVHCGRPILIVPKNVGSLAAQHILVGWKEAREARRAVRDALPFLKRAQRVSIIQVDEDGGGAVDLAPLADVAAYLASHNVTVAATLTPPVRDSIATTLTGVAREADADLLVTGGYGRSRVKEWAFGGVTRDLLVSSPVCCLLSH